MNALPKKVVIFDIDGTIANIEHRRKYLNKAKPDWKSFNDEMGGDTPNLAVVDLYLKLWEADCYELIFVSGRSEEYRKMTEQWLFWNNIPFETLFMRKSNDSKADYLVKEEILKDLQARGKEVLFTVDDRQQVVDMWRRNGITCLQCDKGDF